MSSECYSYLQMQLVYMDLIVKSLKKDGLVITSHVLGVVQNALYEYVFGTAKQAIEAIPSAEDIQSLYKKVKSKLLGE